jgi:hypothetical protein
LARFIARREGHRRIMISDIEAARDEIIPRRATPARDSKLSEGLQSGTCRASARAAKRAVKPSLMAPARAVQPSGMQPSIGRKAPRFSTRGDALEVAETDLVHVDT